VVTPRAARQDRALPGLRLGIAAHDSRPGRARAPHPSCHGHRESTARSQRHRERMAEVDRTPKTCRHQHADHRHGTRAMYTLDNCRCLPCSAACTEYERQGKRRRARGSRAASRRGCVARWWAGCVWRVVGHRRRTSARTSTRPRSRTRRSPVSGPSRWPGARGRAAGQVRRPPARSRYRTRAGTVNVPAIGARRRLQALMWRGWSVPRLAALAGVDRQCLDGALRKGNIYARTHVGVTALYDRLWDQRPPETCHRERISAARSRNRAATNGWVAPLDWGRRQDRRPDSHRNREARQGQRTPRRRAHREGSDHTRAPRPETVNRIRDEHLGGAV
jgi:hypothetical protein